MTYNFEVKEKKSSLFWKSGSNHSGTKQSTKVGQKEKDQPLGQKTKGADKRDKKPFRIRYFFPFLSCSSLTVVHLEKIGYDRALSNVTLHGSAVAIARHIRIRATRNQNRKMRNASAKSSSIKKGTKTTTGSENTFRKDKTIHSLSKDARTMGGERDMIAKPWQIRLTYSTNNMALREEMMFPFSSSSSSSSSQHKLLLPEQKVAARLFRHLTVSATP